jgi:hypothetical protein
MTKAVQRDPLPLVVALACGYEAVAILSGERLPTITGLQHRYRPLGWIIVGWLSYHFLYHEEIAHEELVEKVAETAAARAIRRARVLGLLQRSPG